MEMKSYMREITLLCDMNGMLRIVSVLSEETFGAPGQTVCE
jgi:hypothetical protein